MDVEQITSELSSRRGFLKLAGLAGGLAGAGLVGFDKVFAAAPASADSITDIINGALTAERLAVTFLTTALNTTAVVGGMDANTKIQVQTILDAERFHRDALVSLAATPLDAGQFYVPNGALASTSSFFATAITLETVFVGAYLVAIAELLQRGTAYIDLAVIAGQFMGVEAEHRAIARFAHGDVPPADLAFERYLFTTFAYGNDHAAPDPNGVLAAALPFVTGGAGFTGPVAYPSDAAVAAAIGGHTATVPGALAGQAAIPGSPALGTTRTSSS